MRERYEEAKKNVENYIREGLLKTSPYTKSYAESFSKNSEESLLLAQHIFKEKLSSRWVVVISYYAMFYSSQAYLLKKGLKTEAKIVHKVTADALYIYAREELKNSFLKEYELAFEEALELSEKIVESFDLERKKRSNMQYETHEEIKKERAKTSIERAKKFCFELEKIM